MNANLTEILNEVKGLDLEAFHSLITHIKSDKCGKGKHLLRFSNICDSIYFIETGKLREYIITNEKEYNIWFSFQGDIVCDMQSFVLNRRSIKNIECLSDVSYRYIKREDILMLASRYHVIESFYRKLVESYFIEVESRLLRMQTLDAKAHYDYLVHFNPDFLSDISLTHLASYLGITKESLSRIRKKI